MCGEVCHRWYSPEGLNYAFLLPNGNLLARTGSASEGQGIGGSSKSIVELDWESNVVWETRFPLLHHDFHRTNEGTTLALAWETLPRELADSVSGGCQEDHPRPGMSGYKVVAIAHDGPALPSWNS